MNPNQPTGLPPQQNPYEFITSPQQPQKSPLGGNSMTQRIIIVAVGVVILIVVATIVMSLLSSAGKGGSNELKNVYSEQQELIRIAELGAEDAIGTDARGFAITVSATTQTSQQELSTLLSNRGIKVSDEEIATNFNPNVEDILTGAAANNRYDETLRELLEKQIREYNQVLQSAYNSNEGTATRETLSQAFSSASTLLPKQAEAN